MCPLPLFYVHHCNANGPQNLYLIIPGPKADQTAPNWPHRAGQVQCASGQRALQGGEGGLDSIAVSVFVVILVEFDRI